MSKQSFSQICMGRHEGVVINLCTRHGEARDTMMGNHDNLS